MRRRAPGLLVVALVLASAGCVGGSEPVDPRTDFGGVVAASLPIPAKAGAAVLAAGGNAFDAAAVVQFTLNVVEPQMSGIGGGAFLMFWLANESRVVILDGREVAPAASTPDQFMGPAGQPQQHAVAHRQGYAVGVPGTLIVWDEALKRHGTITLGEALGPAIRVAEDGFPVDRFLAGYLQDALVAEKLNSWPASAELFYPGTVCPLAEGLPAVPACTYGEAPNTGDVLRNPDLAATFRRIQSDGIGAFYGPAIGQAIVDAVSEREGRMTLGDLTDYEIVERDAIRGSYGPYEVLSMPPPGGGIVVQQVLGLLEPFEIAEQGHNSAASLHLTLEAMHVAYADRAKHLGDPAFVDVPVAGLLHPDYLAERRALIDPARSNPDVKAGDPWKYEGRNGSSPDPGSGGELGEHTTHYVVVDRWGNVASVTTTIESVFGTGITVPGHGFLLNNELTDFDYRPGGANQVEPGKRPRSSMSPTIVLLDGEPVFATGSPGGVTIIATVAQSLLNDLEHGLNIEDTVQAPRVYSTSHPGFAWESGIPPPILDALRGKGHDPSGSPSVLGDVQAAKRLADGSWDGEADHRRVGGVAYVDDGAP